MPIILRRRKLGRTSCKEIARLSTTGITVVRNDKPIVADKLDYLFRWGTTSNVPHHLTVVNDAKAIHWVADKATSRKIMADAGLSPKTWLSWEDYIDEWEVEWDRTTELDVPVIIRPAVHAQGRNVFHCSTIGELKDAWDVVGQSGYISEFIDKVAEYRVFVVSGRVACVARKTPADEKAIAWNVAQGGRFDNVRWGDWPIDAIRVAIEAFKLSGLDFGGVDVMVDARGQAYVLEINSAPSLTSPYRQECMAKCFDYIVENGKDFIPVEDARITWRSVIHPAVTKKD